MTPAAVVEVLSLGYEEKDLGPDGAPFYLAYGVQDVLIVDPRGDVVYHDVPCQERRTLTAPATIDLTCGCRVTVARQT